MDELHNGRETMSLRDEILQRENAILSRYTTNMFFIPNRHVFYSQFSKISRINDYQSYNFSIATRTFEETSRSIQSRLVLTVNWVSIKIIHCFAFPAIKFDVYMTCDMITGPFQEQLPTNR